MTLWFYIGLALVTGSTIGWMFFYLADRISKLERRVMNLEWRETPPTEEMVTQALKKHSEQLIKNVEQSNALYQQFRGKEDER